MAQLPADRTKLALAQSNLTPSLVSNSTRLKDAVTEAYDTLDLLNQKVDTHGSAATLPHPDGSVVESKLATDSVVTTKIKDGNVTTAKLADGAITTAKIADANVTTAKIADSNVTTAKIATGAVTGTKIANGSVDSQHIAGTLLASAASLATQAEFDKRGVNVQKYGATGAGGDDTVAFNTAAAYALSIGASLKLPRGEYHLYLSSLGVAAPFSIPSLIGDGIEQTKVVIHGLLHFTIPTGFMCKDMRIECDYVKPNTDGSSMPYLFSNITTMVKNASFENVELVNTSAATDGTSRGMGLFGGFFDGLKVNNVLVVGARNGMTVTNGSGVVVGGQTLRSKRIKLSNVRFENAQVGLYLQGSTVYDRTTYIRAVNIENISLINTEAQRNSYSQLSGADLLVFEMVRDVIVSGLYAERACERATYFNVCSNVNVTGVELISTEGLKFVGYSDGTVGAQYADGFTCTNVHIVDDDNNGNAGYGFILYNCKNVKISNVQLDGKGNDTKITRAFHTSRYLENVTIENITARYLKGGLLYYLDDASVTLATGIKDFTARNITVIDPEIGSGRFDLFHFDVLTPPANGTYIFNNFRLENITSKSTVNYSAPTPAIGQKEYTLRGDGLAAVGALIKINHVNGLRTKANVMEGISDIYTMINVGTNSRNIILEEHNFWMNLITAPASVSGLNYSYPTTVRVMEQDTTRGVVFERKFRAITDPSDAFGVTRNLLLNCEIEIDGRITLVSTDEAKLVANWVPNCFGIGRVIASNGEWMQFAVNGVTVTKIASSANFGINNDPSMSSVFTYPSTQNYLALRNRTAVTLNYKVEFKGIFKQ